MGLIVTMREAERDLLAAGCELLKGRHRKWSHPDGRTVTLPNARPGTVLYGWLGQAVQKLVADDVEGRKSNAISAEHP